LRRLHAAALDRLEDMEGCGLMPRVPLTIDGRQFVVSIAAWMGWQEMPRRDTDHVRKYEPVGDWHETIIVHEVVNGEERIASPDDAEMAERVLKDLRRLGM
jgi:hypothetical protein